MSKPSSPDRLATLRFRRLWWSFLSDQEPIAAAVPDQISADDVVAPPSGGVDPEADARSASVNDDVVGDQVAVSLLDPDAARGLGRCGFGRSRFGCRGRAGSPAPFRTKRLRRTRLRVASLQEDSVASLRENRFPLIRLSVESNATWMPGWALCRNELFRIRT